MILDLAMISLFFYFILSAHVLVTFLSLWHNTGHLQVKGGKVHFGSVCRGFSPQASGFKVAELHGRGAPQRWGHGKQGMKGEGWELHPAGPSS